MHVRALKSKWLIYGISICIQCLKEWCSECHIVQCGPDAWGKSHWCKCLGLEIAKGSKINILCGFTISVFKQDLWYQLLAVSRIKRLNLVMTVLCTNTITYIYIAVAACDYPDVLVKLSLELIFRSAVRMSFKRFMYGRLAKNNQPY